MSHFKRAIEAVWFAASGYKADVTATGMAPSTAEIIDIAAYRSTIQELSDKLRASKSIFQQAFGCALEDIIDGYLKDLATLEAKCVEGVITTEADIRFALHHYSATLPAIIKCTRKIIDDNLIGGAVCTTVCDVLAGIGDGASRAVWQRILHVVSRPLYSLLSNWMAYGDFTDPEAEFFIRVKSLQGSGDKVATGEGGRAGAGMLFRSGSLSPVDDDPFGVTTRQHLPIQLQQLHAEEEFLRGASVDYELLPSQLISERMAQDILLIGTAVKLLRYNNDDAVAEWQHITTNSTTTTDGASPHSIDAPFSFLDSLQIANMLDQLRELPEVTPETVEFVVSKVKEMVFRHLWHLLVRRGGLLSHLQAFRDYFLLGRGDLFRAFHEKLKPLRSVSTLHPLSLVHQVTSGPWQLAAHIANIKAELAEGADDRFDSCYWYLFQKASKWTAPDPLMLSFSAGLDDDSFSERSSKTLPRTLAGWVAQGAATSMKNWVPPQFPDAALRQSYLDTSVVRLGSSGPEGLHAQRNPVGSDHAMRAGRMDSPLATALADEALWNLEVLFVAKPPQSIRSTGVDAGAVWSTCPIVLRSGFLVRSTVHVHMKAFRSAEGQDRLPLDTASYAVVLQREGLLACGSSSSACGKVPPAGYDPISTSLVAHILCKRSVNVNVSEAKFRVVVALYGPATVSRSGPERKLLASGVIMDHTVQASYFYMSPYDGQLMVAYPLSVAIQYIPGIAIIGGEGKVGRMCVHLHDGAPVSRVRSDTGLGSQRATQPVSGVQKRPPIVDIPLVLENAMDFLSWKGPGADRAYVGLTADAGCSPMPLISLDHIDTLSLSSQDDGLAGLTLCYQVPWPLHAILSSSAIALHQDLFGVLFRTKSVSLSLQETWRLLMDSFSLSASTGAGVVTDGRPDADETDSFATTATRRGRRFSTRSDVSFTSTVSARSGVSAQVSGFGGKRSKDPAVYARQRMRIAVHRLLQPVWLCRSQMSSIIDALLYHLHVDVIEASFTKFYNEMRESKDFASLMRANDEYLHAIRNGCFLAQPSLMACMHRILGACEVFVKLVATNAANLASMLQPSGDRDAFTEISGTFQGETRMLLGLLQTGIKWADASALITRLDFNGYFGIAPPT